MKVLDSIHNPDNLRALSSAELRSLAKEVREKLVDVVSKNGGHLASNLGAVELTIALHRAFNSPNDKIVFDVSHQTYVHKLLTGRNDERFANIRKTGGYSGFADPTESEHDTFVAGHAGTALSVALGFAYARDKTSNHKENHVVAVIGDASLSCGITLEALNNVSLTTNRLIIIVNDNEFSIDKNVGAISIYLNGIIKSCLYKRVTACIKQILGNGDFGKSIVQYVRRLKRAVKGVLLPTSYFEYYGLRYFGPVDGHNIAHLEEIFEFCKNSDRPILVHVKTVKGKGLIDAMERPEKFHGVEPANVITCDLHGVSSEKISYGEILGHEITKLAKQDRRIVGVVAAMANGTGLAYLRDNLSGQYVDVGIAEEHAVTFSAALAKAGMLPICAIYSTFMQRAFDQVLHDVCLQNLPVVFCLDRAGISAHDGATHHGTFDLSYLRMIPNAVILQPRSAQDFINIFHSAMKWSRPTFIRYPKSCLCAPSEYLEFSEFIELGKSEEISHGDKVCIFALGNMLDLADEVSIRLAIHGVTAGIVNARFVKPLDEAMLLKISKKYKFIVTLEDNVLSGGFGSAVLEFYSDRGIDAKVLRFGWPDKFIKHGSSPEILREENNLSAENISEKILAATNI